MVSNSNLGAFPATQCSIYRSGFSIIGPEAAVAAFLFALTTFVLIKNKKWAPFLAIALTINQRIFSNYAFFPTPADIQVQPLILIPNGATLIWSFIIIYFAYKDIKQRNRVFFYDHSSYLGCFSFFTLNIYFLEDLSFESSD